jgi:hypothetical protein
MTMIDNVAVPMTMTDEFVRCVNHTDKPEYFTWAARDYQVKPNSEAFVPFQAMCTRFGHPQSGMVTAGQIPARDYELRRLEGQFGVSSFDARAEGKSILELMQEKCPNVEFYQLDGTRIITVMDDPEGELALRNYDEGTPNDPATLQAMVIRLREQQNYLQQALEAQQQGNMRTIDTVPEDEPGAGLGTPQKPRGVKGHIQSTPPPMPPDDEIQLPTEGDE